MNAPPSRFGAERPDESAVQIGALAPLARPGWVEAGWHLLAGLELGVADVNDAGGIGGRPLELVIRDTAADPQRATAAVDELARLGVAALAGEYHSVVARAAAAQADALGLPFLCSSAVLDALTEEPTQWVARLAPAQSHGWQIYADFLLGAGHSRIAVATEPSVYWASGARILRDYLSPRGGTVIELDARELAPAAVCDELASNRATALLLLAGFPEPAVPIVKSVRHDQRLAEIMIGAPPARAPQPTRRTSRDGPPRAASRSALLRRVRGLRHCRGPRRHAAFCRPGSGAHGRILAARCSRRYPRADPVLPHARHQRLAMGLDANPSRGSGPGTTRPLPSPPRHLREHRG
jgi:hypothetical protein